MANYLKFDGLNDQALAVDSAGSWPSDGVMTYEIVFTRGSVALNGGVADAFCPANGRGLYLTDATFQLYWDFGSFRSTYTFNNSVIEGEDKKLRFEFLADKITVNVYEDDILHTVITSNKTIPAASDDVNVGTRYGGSSPCNALIRYIKRTVPSSVADSRFWDADSSDTSNTGQQPVLTETLNGFDAIGVNMNTDGSDWVTTGDPTPSGVNSSIIGDSLLPNGNFAAEQSTPEYNASLSGSSILPVGSFNCNHSIPEYNAGVSGSSVLPNGALSVSSEAPTLNASISGANLLPVGQLVVSRDIAGVVTSLTGDSILPGGHLALSYEYPDAGLSINGLSILPVGNIGINQERPPAGTNIQGSAILPVGQTLHFASTVPSFTIDIGGDALIPSGSVQVFNGTITQVTPEGNKLKFTPLTRRFKFTAQKRCLC